MKILTAVFLFLGMALIPAPSSADVVGTASGSLGGGSPIQPMTSTAPNVTPMQLSPLNMAPPNVTPMQLPPPNITPMGLSGPNITPANIQPMNLTPPNISPANIAPLNLSPANVIPATSINPAHIEHFQAGMAAQQASQQKIWEDQMAERQKQLDKTRMEAEAKAAEAAAKLAPAAGVSAPPAPYEPSSFLVGLVKLVNVFAPHHQDRAATSP